jgi:hypothetical protein
LNALNGAKDVMIENEFTDLALASFPWSEPWAQTADVHQKTTSQNQCCKNVMKSETHNHDE